MPYSSFPVQVLLSVLFCAACDDAASEQKAAATAQTEANTKIITVTNEANQKVANAQAEANTQIGAAGVEADQKARDAQLEADKKVAAANESFLKMREELRHSTETNLIELDRNVADLEVRAKKANGKARIELNAQLKQIHAQREAFSSSCKALEAETASTWDGAKVRIDKEWAALKALVDAR
jgi:hypothetical protein